MCLQNLNVALQSCTSRPLKNINVLFGSILLISSLMKASSSWRKHNKVLCALFSALIIFLFPQTPDQFWQTPTAAADFHGATERSCCRRRPNWTQKPDGRRYHSRERRVRQGRKMFITSGVAQSSWEDCEELTVRTADSLSFLKANQQLQEMSHRYH